jgi:hypothetical protein
LTNLELCAANPSRQTGRRRLQDHYVILTAPVQAYVDLLISGSQIRRRSDERHDGHLGREKKRGLLSIE